MSTPVAAIDCGTNSIRLLIAQPDGRGGLHDLVRRMEIVRLGYGVDRTGRFDSAALSRTVAAVRDYRDLIREHGVQSIRFAATSATRDASNRDELIGAVVDLLGVAPEVITGQEEAELSFRGAVQTLPDLAPGKRLVVDIGGGSTELVLGEDHPERRISLDIGSVRLTERCLRSDPPYPQEIQEALSVIDEHLDRAAQVVPLEQTDVLVGVAGTVTTITALAVGVESYSPEVTHGAHLPIERTLAVCEELWSESRAQRAERSVIHPGRVDVIGAGALIWARIVERVRRSAGITESVTSEHDILDGLALGLCDSVNTRP